MSEDNMNDLINNVKSMVDSGNIPDNIQELLKNFSSNSSNNDSTSNNSSNENNGNDASNLLNMLSKNLGNASSFNDNTSSSDNSNEQNSNNRNNISDFASSIDIGTILKMKTIIESMNKKDDPRANLLYSLKPYLRDSRKNKLDQYVNLLNMTKIADVLKKEGGL